MVRTCTDEPILGDPKKDEPMTFVLLIFLCSGPFAPSQPRWQACLPQVVKETQLVSSEPGRKNGVVSKLTVKRRLNQLGARCRKGKLVDATRREIRFYRLVGCWGNAPMNYLEILERQRSEIRQLRKHYTVIEIPCNPSGLLIP